MNFEKLLVKSTYISQQAYEKSNESNRFLLPGLDSLRAIASLAVIIGHVELIKENNGLPNLLGYFSFQGNLIGHLGVIFFFVLSGFLITFLMLNELALSKTVDVVGFYLRRIKRIFPLYYGILIISGLITGFIPSLVTLLLCFTIMPNIAEVIGKSWIPSPQIWSIGVEQQFYLFWPFFVLFFRKHLLKALLIFFVIWSLIPHFLQWYFIHYTTKDYTMIVNDLFIMHGMKFNCLALGGIIAHFIPLAGGGVRI